MEHFLNTIKNIVKGHFEQSNARFDRIAPLRMTFVTLILIAGFWTDIYAQSSNDFRFHFREGDLHRVVTTEILRLGFHFPQVDEQNAKPSVRTSVYCFTERVDSVLPGGSAIIAASLDSFKTGIDIGEGEHAENFFRFNSAGDWDITHELHDIKVLPRAQFLGQTIRFVMRPDGTIKEFLNLQDFHQAAIGHGYDYDLVHAMLSLSDSLRMGQLLEFGFGGMAAVKEPYTSPSTTTEIPIKRTVSARRLNAETLDVHARYFDPPNRIEYLEGIAMPLGVLHYHGSGSGSIMFAKGNFLRSEYQDTARVLLKVDIDTVPEDITRSVTTEIFPISVLHGRNVSIKEISIHSGVNTDSLEDALKGSVPNAHNHGNKNVTPSANPETQPAKDNSDFDSH
jgi:hypothetical protein